MRKAPDLLLRLEIEAPHQAFRIEPVPSRINVPDKLHMPREGCRTVEAHIFGDKANFALSEGLLSRHCVA
jgi:hypothetical protein